MTRNTLPLPVRHLYPRISKALMHIHRLPRRIGAFCCEGSRRDGRRSPRCHTWWPLPLSASQSCQSLSRRSTYSRTCRPAAGQLGQDYLSFVTEAIVAPVRLPTSPPRRSSALASPSPPFNLFLHFPAILGKPVANSRSSGIGATGKSSCGVGVPPEQRNGLHAFSTRSGVNQTDPVFGQCIAIWRFKNSQFV